MDTKRHLIIGDVHGDHKGMDHLIRSAIEAWGEVDRIVQVGDFGYFPRTLSPPRVDHGVPQIFLRGNHEDHSTIHTLTYWGAWEYAKDGYMDEYGCLFLGGAMCTDREERGQGGPYGWHDNEELEDEGWERIMDETDFTQVKYVFSHDCPDFLLPMIKPQRKYTTKTSLWLQKVANEVSNVEWFFGHHHTTGSWMIGDNRYRLIDMISNGRNRSMYVLETD